MDDDITQTKIIMEFFTNNPNRDIQHPEVVDWVSEEWKKRTGKAFRDPDRQIRQLAQSGKLQKIEKGLYRYNPDFISNPELEDFSQSQKNEILERDNYRCVICGKGREYGVELHVDHIKPKDLGGKATVENGQTLCAQHNFKKKNYKQTETGKKMFIRLYELAKNIGDAETQSFCAEILEVFEKNGVNGHIKWER
ncbi:HNH endonuclease [Treponema endosymbiont of Eucomonympha sp.]|uniref:HNH endonuclease n=1 Tax=Treponema endosymbiont of Eucomonympha sp. TaxID=1580831 RepID=UPI0007802D04|nr:HNH endonuclease [Treponema endosymbiont of Eucomonympha sp.]